MQVWHRHSHHRHIALCSGPKGFVALRQDPEINLVIWQHAIPTFLMRDIRNSAHTALRKLELGLGTRPDGEPCLVDGGYRMADMAEYRARCIVESRLHRRLAQIGEAFQEFGGLDREEVSVDLRTHRRPSEGTLRLHVDGRKYRIIVPLYGAQTEYLVQDFRSGDVPQHDRRDWMRWYRRWHTGVDRVQEIPLGAAALFRCQDDPVGIPLMHRAPNRSGELRAFAVVFPSFS